MGAVILSGKLDKKIKSFDAATKWYEKTRKADLIEYGQDPYSGTFGALHAIKFQTHMTFNNLEEVEEYYNGRDVKGLCVIVTVKDVNTETKALVEARNNLRQLADAVWRASGAERESANKIHNKAIASYRKKLSAAEARCNKTCWAFYACCPS